MDVTAVCERSGDWWAVSVPEVSGAFTQAKRLDQVPAMVADAVALLTGVPATEVVVRIDAHVSGTAAAEELRAAQILEDRLRDLLIAANSHRALALQHYKEAGLSTRDIGQLAGISYQRVSQILMNLKNSEVLTSNADKGVDMVLRAGSRVVAIELKTGSVKSWEAIRSIAEQVTDGQSTEDEAIARASQLLRENGGGDLAVFTEDGARAADVVV